LVTEIEEAVRGSNVSIAHTSIVWCSLTYARRGLSCCPPPAECLGGQTASKPEGCSLSREAVG
jgi:hypothetical protein